MPVPPKEYPVPSPEVARIYARAVGQLESGDELDLAGICSAHPEHSDSLRTLHENWQRVREARTQATLAERLMYRYGPDADPKVSLQGAAESASDISSGVLARLASRQPATSRYKIEGEVARGGMGVILRVWDEDLRRRLAMKVMLGQNTPTDRAQSSSSEPKMLARFLEEAQVTGQLDHPGIVPVHELGLDAEGCVYFTMKLVKGKTLQDVFDELALGEGGWTQTRVLGQLLKVCEAMAYAHDKQVIHRDLKPANIMVGRYGEVYVMDWGLARILGREDDRDLRIQPEMPTNLSEVRSDRREHAGQTPDSSLYTMDGDVVGTPAYMSPEQASGQLNQMGPHSDVYALGAMLYHLVAGHIPYALKGQPANNYAIWHRVREGSPKALHEIATGAPAELVAICEKAMTREVQHRYADMSALAEDLSAYVEGRVVRAYETGAWAEARKWVGRNRALASAVMAAGLLLCAGLVASLLLKNRADGNYALAENRRKAEETARLQATDNQALAELRHRESERRSYTAFLLAAEAARKEGNNLEARRLHELCPQQYRGWEWGHLGLQLDRSSRVLRGHSQGVRAVATSPDGTGIVSVSFDDTIRLWNTATGDSQPLVMLDELGNAWRSRRIMAAAFSENGRSVVALMGGDSRSEPDHRKFQSPPRRPSRVVGDRVPPGGAGGGGGFWWAVWSAATGKLVSRGSRGGSALALSPNGRQIVFRLPEDDGAPRLLDIHSESEVVLEGLPGNVAANGGFQFSSNGQNVTAFSTDNTLYNWETGQGMLRGWRRLPVDEGSTLCVSPDALRVVVRSASGGVQVCDLEGSDDGLVLDGHADRVTSAAFSPDGGRIVTGSRDNTLRLWNAATGAQLDVLSGHSSWVEAVDFNSDGTRIVSASLDGDLRIWSAVASGPEHLVRAPTSLGWGGTPETAARWDAVAFSPDCRLVVSAEKPRPTDGLNHWGYVWPEVRVWDLATREILFALEGHSWGIGAMSFSADGRRIVSGSDDQTVRIWDAEDGQCLLTFAGHDDSVYAVALSSDGRQVVSSSATGDVKIWDSTTGEELRDLPTPKGWQVARSLAVSPDGETIAAGGDDSVLVWSVNAGLDPRILAHEKAVGTVAFSPDGTRLVTGSWDRKVRVWDWESETLLVVLEGHTTAVGKVTYHTDGDRILSGGDTLRVWDAATFETLYVLDEMDPVAIGFDGHRILAARQDCTVRTWESDLDESAALGRADQQLRDSLGLLASLRPGQEPIEAVLREFDTASTSQAARDQARSIVRWLAAVQDLRMVQELLKSVFIEKGDVTIEGVEVALTARPKLSEGVLQRARTVVGRLVPLASDQTWSLDNRAWRVVDPDRTSSGDVAVALVYARAAVSRNPDSSTFQRHLAWALFANGIPAEAITAARQALTLATADAADECQNTLDRLEPAPPELWAGITLDGIAAGYPPHGTLVGLGEDSLRWTDSFGSSWTLLLDRSKGILRAGPDCPEFDPESSEKSDVAIILRRDSGGRYVLNVKGLQFGAKLYERNMFGFTSSPPGSRRVRELGLVRYDSLEVRSVTLGSAAESAGLRRGDIITRVAGRPASLPTVDQAKEERDFGDLVPFDVVRGERTLRIEIPIGVSVRE